MTEILASILTVVARELLLPLAKELLKIIVSEDEKDIGVNCDDYKEITDIMAKSKRNEK